MGSVVIAQRAIELQAPLQYRDGGQVVTAGRLQVRGNKVAGAVDILRPGIRGGQLESVTEPPVQARLESMIRGVSLVVEHLDQSVIGI